MQLPGTIYSSPGPFHPSHDTIASFNLYGYGISVLHYQTGFSPSKPIFLHLI